MTNVQTLRKPKVRVIFDSWIMTERCLTTSLRNPDVIGTAIFVPAFVMMLFGLVFGNVMDVGD